MEEHDSPQPALRAEIERLRARVGELEQDSARLETLLANLTRGGMLTDSTRRVRTDERLRRLSSALEQSIDAVVVCDLTGVIVEANAAALELFGATREGDLVGHNSFAFVNPQDAEKATRDMAKLLDEGRLKGVETRFQSRGGDVMLLELNMSVISDAEGAPSGIVSVLRDRTAQRQLEDELLKARKLESIGLLAGGIAHDFNNVLSAILGNLNVARARCEPGHQAVAPLVDAEKATLRARRLTQRLLTFAHGGEPIKASVPVAELLDAAVDQSLPADAPRPKIDLPEDLWAAEADAGQVQQALENLLRNALESGGPEAPVTISARNVRVREGTSALLPGSYVQIAFEDRGPAIPPARHADVFDPYFGAKNTDSALALATALSIASRHGGTITVESAPDAGSVFALYLPASLSPTQEHAIQRTLVAGEGRRVLVMDDEEMVRRVARRMLEAMGFDVTLTANGEEAITRYEEARAAAQPFHAVMLDLTVPGGLGGRETLERLRALDPAVRAIVASGYSDDAVMSHYAEHGFRAVLAKPYQITELAAALHRTL